MSYLLQAEEITKSYGTIDVLRKLSFEVSEGEVFAIIGPNGAGKTTLFKVLTGEVLVNSGRIHYASRDVTTQPQHRRVAAGMGRSFQVSRIFPEMTACDNMVVAIESRTDAVHARWYRVRPAAATIAEAEERLAKIGLADKSAIEARFLSHGDKKRLEFAMMLARNPRMMMMDEPMAGMSPSDRHKTLTLLKTTLAEYRQTILLTEHDMDVVFELADRIMVLNYGELIALGSQKEIRANKAVRDVYLGQEIELAVD